MSLAVLRSMLLALARDRAALALSFVLAGGVLPGVRGDFRRRLRGRAAPRRGAGGRRR